MVNPRRICNFARAAGKLAKTDRLNAAAMAHFTAAIRPPARPVPDAKAPALGGRVARPRQAIEMIVAAQNRRRCAGQRRGIRAIERHRGLPRRELSERDGEIDKPVRDSPVWQADAEPLHSVPGSGPATLRTLIAELPEPGRPTRRRIAAPVGLAPVSRDSGTLRGRRTLAGRRSAVRAALFMATLVASRRNPVIASYDNKLPATGKPAKQSLVACMRKLPVILDAILRDQKPWKTA